MTEIMPFPENNYETVLLNRPESRSFCVPPGLRPMPGRRENAVAAATKFLFTFSGLSAMIKEKPGGKKYESSFP